MVVNKHRRFFRMLDYCNFLVSSLCPFQQCVVPENLHTLASHERFLVWKPPPPHPWKFQFSFIPSFKKYWLLRPPPPSEFPITFDGRGMDILWNHTIWDQLVCFYYQVSLFGRTPVCRTEDHRFPSLFLVQCPTPDVK